MNKLAADFPAQKSQVESARKYMLEARAHDQLEHLKRMRDAGRYKALQEGLESFPEKEASAVTTAEFRTLKASFDETAEKFADLQHLLEDLGKRMQQAPEGLANALSAVRSELHLDRTNRLEAFLGQALQAERQRKSGKTPEISPSALASLAITGWLLGNPNAEPKADVALRLWHSRELVLDYLRTDDIAVREKLLRKYAAKKADYIGMDEFCQIIPHLPPTLAEPSPGLGTLFLQAGAGVNPARYLLKLPPEYSHNRLYPVLMALPPFSEPEALTVQRLEQFCAEYGYILAVPHWEENKGTDYAFSEREHQIALDVLRDLRRRFQVDSDRVFLTGAGDGGGMMAFDVALSHPDLFAGAIPM
ncbi:MAG: hypothetical protein ACRD36_11590, partial [Candidatus Acidiferrum sp.]